MPRFNALEIDISLAVTSLHDTLSDNIELRMGSSQKKDAGRIDAALRGGRKLLERPIRDSEVGVLQYLGASGDMAFFVAEAGDGVPASSISSRAANSVVSECAVGAMDDSSHQSTNLESIVFYDNMPVLADVVAIKTPPSQRSHTQSKATSSGRTAPTTTSPLPGHMRRLLSDEPEQQALSICVGYSDKTFLRRERAATTTGKDLKFEIYINGEFADISYVSTRRSGATAKKNGGIEVFSGQRFHRQAEKPWIYQHVADQNDELDIDGSHRWADIQDALRQAADVRGVNKYGQRTMTDDFLLALAELETPDHLKPKSANIGVIDIVITAGSGRKYGPETPYIGVPTRMDDKKPGASTKNTSAVGTPVMDVVSGSTVRDSPGTSVIDPVLLASSPALPPPRRSWTTSTIDPQLQSKGVVTPQVGRLLAMPVIDPQLLPESPTMHQAKQSPTPSLVNPQLQLDILALAQPHRSLASMDVEHESLPDSPALPQAGPKRSNRRAQSYELVQSNPTAKHGAEQYKAIKTTPQQKYIESYENAHGRPGGKRSTRQRVGDMRKMSPEKQKVVLQELKSQLSAQDIAAIMESLEIDANALEESPSKKVRFRSPVPGPEPEADLFAHDKDISDSPILQPVVREHTPTFAEIFAAQESTMYDSSMIPSRYEHIDPRLLSLNPHSNTPEPAVVQQRVDMALELGANESGALMQKLSPVKRRQTPASSLSYGPVELDVKKHGNAGRKKTALSAAPTDLREPLPSPSPRRKALTPKKGSETREALMAAEAEESFVVPRLSEGSAVGYAAAGVQRQIGKIRGGEFEEEEFLVGMRFYVW